QGPQGADRRLGMAVLVPGKQLRTIDIDATEMDENQRPLRRIPTPLAPRHRALRQIPVCEVVTLVAQDYDVREHARHEINPFLIGEQSRSDVVDRSELETIGPPCDQAIGLGMRSDRDESA